MQDSIDILALQEPFVFNNRIPFSLSSRVFHSHPFNDTIYSAIVVINNSLIIQHLHDFTNFFASSILIQTRSKYLVFVNVYIHPGTFCDTHCNFFDSLLSSYPNYPIILCGDFNARNPYWYDSVTNSNGYRLKNVIDSHNLIILNNKSKTCRQASIIDLTITNSMAYSYIYNWHVTRFTELSDHETIKFDIVSSHDNFENYHIKSTWKFIEENMECYNNNIDQHFISELNQFINDCSNHSDLNVATNKLAKIYIEAAYKSFNVRKPSNYPKKFTWWTKSLDNQKRYFQYIKNLYYRNNSQISYDFYKNVRNNYVRCIRKAKQDSFRSFLEEADSVNHFGNTFKLLKLLISKPNNRIPMIDCLPAIDKQQKMNHILNQMFPDDDSSSDNQVAASIRHHHLALNNSSDVLISVDEIILIIKNLNVKKAPGLDYVSNRMIKSSCDLLAPSICALFNKCLGLHYFPYDWECAGVRIIPKPNKNDYDDTKSYRPISLISNLAKIFEKILKIKIYDQFCHLLNPNQHGFVKNKSTSSALSSITIVYITIYN